MTSTESSAARPPLLPQLKALFRCPPARRRSEDEEMARLREEMEVIQRRLRANEVEIERREREREAQLAQQARLAHLRSRFLSIALESEEDDDDVAPGDRPINVLRLLKKNDPPNPPRR